MKNEDFSECKLINDILCFLTYDEFCKYKYFIRNNYKNLTKNGKLFYKYYVYANIHIDTLRKDRIWNFLNCEDFQTDFELMQALENYKAKF